MENDSKIYQLAPMDKWYLLQCPHLECQKKFAEHYEEPPVIINGETAKFVTYEGKCPYCKEQARQVLLQHGPVPKKDVPRTLIVDWHKRQQQK